MRCWWVARVVVRSQAAEDCAPFHFGGVNLERHRFGLVLQGANDGAEQVVLWAPSDDLASPEIYNTNAQEAVVVTSHLK
jgi:hypothetical protein